MGNLEVLHLDSHLGFWNPRTKKRLPNLFGNKQIQVKRKATAFIGGFNYMMTDDLHQEVRGRVSEARYRKLAKKYKSQPLHYSKRYGWSEGSIKQR